MLYARRNIFLMCHYNGETLKTCVICKHHPLKFVPTIRIGGKNQLKRVIFGKRYCSHETILTTRRSSKSCHTDHYRNREKNNNMYRLQHCRLRRKRSHVAASQQRGYLDKCISPLLTATLTTTRTRITNETEQLICT